MAHSPSHIKDIGGYIYFSPKTQGLSGFAVKIHTDLLVDFFCNVDPSTHDGECVIRDIESLKALANTASGPTRVRVKTVGHEAHKARLNKVNERLALMAQQQSLARERTFATKNVRVFYQIDQKDGDRCPTVYISDLQIVHRGKENEGGLYEFARSAIGRRELRKCKNSNLDGKAVYISEASDSAVDAMTSATYATSEASPIVFFNPKSIADDVGSKGIGRLSESTRKLVVELKNLLKQNQSQKVRWHVAGEGAALLAQALSGAPVNLQSHSFQFINARANLGSLLQELNQRKAQLKGEFIHYHRDQSALMAIVRHSHDLLDTLGKLPVGADYDQISRRYLTNYLANLAKNGNAKAVFAKAMAARGTQTTFVDVVTRIQGRQ